MKQVVEYHKAYPHEVRKAREEMPAAYIGLGILEWHGEHNVCGLDGVKADGVCKRLAGELGGVVMPPLFWGENRRDICELQFDPAVSSWIQDDHTQKICDMMGYGKAELVKNAERGDNVGYDLWINLVVHMFFEIESLGFKYIVPVPGHYPLFTPLDRAVEKYMSEGGRCHIIIIKDYMYKEEGFPSGDHAAQFETSLMLALCPEMVDMDSLGTDMEKPPIGVSGNDPRRYACAEFGERIIKQFTEILKKKFAHYENAF